MKTVAVIQARMGSSRLPGKVMLPLAGDHALTHHITRIQATETVDETVVATSTGVQDDIVARYAKRGGAKVYRGSEENVLGRMYEAARQRDADIVIRVTADCPLVSAEQTDYAVRKILDEGFDNVSSILTRTFPRGLTTEAFTFESFKTVYKTANEPHHREHVTPYYRENPDKFDLYNVAADEVFSEEFLQDRTDLRLTLDEADDYELLRRIYEGIEFDESLTIQSAVQYVDSKGLSSLNSNVEQKTK
jgi:spore coat polysaccharide biosynthesis protein SpsF